MRIAYIAPYQGPTFFRSRPSLKNLGLAAIVKIEAISELLLASGHRVEIISQGEVAERGWKFYPALVELESFHAEVPVYYASALPVRFVNGFWSGYSSRGLLRARHQASPFDLVIIYNLQHAQIMCAEDAVRRLRLPYVVEYEDDASVDIAGNSGAGWRSRRNTRMAAQTLKRASGGMAVSPHLLGQLSPAGPRLLLRGVVSDDIIEASKQTDRKNWVVYAGTHTRNKGIEQLIAAWSGVNLADWELHLFGKGEITSALEKRAEGNKSIIFHGLLDRRDYAKLLGQARIGINPHSVSQTPGNIFAFKIVEYIGAGLHCITTPMGALEPEIEAGLTYMPDNSPATIAATLQQVIKNHCYKRLAVEATLNTYGPQAVARSLDGLLQTVMAARPVKSGA